MGKIPPDQKGAESSRPGVSPHRQQASVRSSARPCRNTCGIPTTHTFCPVTNTFRPIGPLPSNLARNSPAAPSNIEFASLELQRFRMVSKNYRLKLCAKFVWARPAIARRCRGLARVLRTRPCSPAWSAPPTPSGSSGLCHTFGGGFAPLGASLRRVAGVSRLYWCNSPRLVAPSTWGELDRGPLMARIPRLPVVRPRFGVVWRPKCRPPRRQTSTTGCRWRGVLRLGGSDAWPGVSLASEPLRCEREPAIACANRLYRT